MQRSQRSDVLVMPTEKLKIFLCMSPCDWLDVTDGPSDAHETGNTLPPGLVSAAEDPFDHLTKSD